ncbi:uncharacterized protein V1518DRAFT_118630 [Limtongia smithiae]|uniref:uncharacterized protein n=1 Tax=Limtongia smithiae TaxID=1125753 RepID=UPI0034CD375B
MSNSDYYGGQGGNQGGYGGQQQGGYEGGNQGYGNQQQEGGETGERGLGKDLLGAAAGAMAGHHLGKSSGHGTLGTIGGAIAGAGITSFFTGEHGEQGQQGGQQGGFGGQAVPVDAGKHVVTATCRSDYNPRSKCA